jgi:microcystin-dependent protein
MGTPYLSQLALFSFNFAPAGWAVCAGQLLPINQNQALFSLLGTTYGGNGQTTFALPDLRGRVPIHFGQGPGLSNYNLGAAGGTESVALGVSQMPAHTHAIDISGLTATERATNAAGNQRTPVGNVPAAESAVVTATYSSAVPNASMNNAAATPGGGVTAAVAGGSQPHENRQPYLALTYCIALQGIFPSRN